jgi:hypothetical protein
MRREGAFFLKNDFLQAALVPPKGWNSWDGYGVSVRESEVRRSASSP